MKATPDTKLKRPLSLILNGETVQLFHHEKGFDSCTVVLPDGTPEVASLSDLELVGKEKPKPIAKATDKRAKENREYMALRKVYLENHQVCEANIKGCTRKATEVHHASGRIGKRLVDVSTFVPLCGNCHHWVEENPVQAKEMGLSANRL